MKFTISSEEIKSRISVASTILSIGASSALRSSSSDKHLSLLIESDADKGTVTFVSENRFGASFRSVVETDVEESGSELLSISELSTVSNVFGKSDILQVESLYSDRVDPEKAYAIELSTSDISVTANIILLGENINPPMFETPKAKAGNFTVDFADLEETWSTGSVAHAPMNDRSKVLKFVHLKYIPEESALRILSASSGSLAFASTPVTSKLDKFEAVVYPDNFDGVLDLLHKAGAERVRFYTNTPDEAVETIINIAGYPAPKKKDDKKSKEDPVIEIRFPAGNVDPTTFVTGRLEKMITDLLTNYIGTVTVDNEDLLSAFSNANTVCSLIPKLTGDNAREIGVSITEGDIMLFLPEDKFDQVVPTEKNSIENDISFKVSWGPFASHFRSSLSGELINIAVFEHKTARGTSQLLCLHSLGDWDYEPETVPNTWMVLAQGEPEEGYRRSIKN